MRYISSIAGPENVWNSKRLIEVFEDLTGIKQENLTGYALMT